MNQNCQPRFEKLVNFIRRIPAVKASVGFHGAVGCGVDNGMWWVKFSIGVDHPLAWSTIQELGHVLNYLSLGERLPTTFKPVSPPPYMNGGPRDFLSWVIECPEEKMSPETVAEWLEGRLPRPVDDESAWMG